MDARADTRRPSRRRCTTCNVRSLASQRISHAADDGNSADASPRPTRTHSIGGLWQYLVAADSQPDDMVLAGLASHSPSENSSPVRSPGHLVDTSRSFDFLDAQPRPKPADSAFFHIEQIGDERPQPILELGLLRRCQPFQVA